MGRQELIVFPVIKADICTMCHWSSNCKKCCKDCKDQCNSIQTCVKERGIKDQQERWNAWNYLKYQ